MTQNQLNREVAKVTGESVDFVRQLGFNVTIVPQQEPRRQEGNQNRARRAHRSKPVHFCHQHRKVAA